VAAQGPVCVYVLVTTVLLAGPTGLQAVCSMHLMPCAAVRGCSHAWLLKRHSLPHPLVPFHADIPKRRALHEAFSTIFVY
jgi:hypothetical protein